MKARDLSSLRCCVVVALVCVLNNLGVPIRLPTSTRRILARCTCKCATGGAVPATFACTTCELPRIEAVELQWCPRARRAARCPKSVTRLHPHCDLPSPSGRPATTMTKKKRMRTKRYCQSLRTMIRRRKMKTIWLRCRPSPSDHAASSVAPPPPPKPPPRGPPFRPSGA